MDEDGRVDINYYEEVNGQFIKTKERLGIKELFEKISDLSEEDRFRFYEDLEILFTVFKDVCPLSLCDREIFYWVDIEAMCERYHTLPNDGGIMKMPTLVRDIFVSLIEGYNRHQSKVTAGIREKTQKGK